MLMSCVSVEISQQTSTRWLFWRDVAVRLSFTNFFSDWPSVDPKSPTAPYDQKDLDVFCRTYASVETLTTKNGWTYQNAKFVDKQFSSQYNRFSCFLLQVPQTFSSLRPPNCVVLHDYNASLQNSSFLYFRLLINCFPWRHRLVMILWLSSQRNRLLQCKQSHEANASKRVRPFIGASDLRPIFI